MASRELGRVRRFCPQRGYGFIQALATGRDVFVHYSNLLAVGFKTLYAGEYVEYTEAVTPAGFAALQVTGVLGGPLMCDAAVTRALPQAPVLAA